jgi:curved DNA-binding protein CbpA
MDTLAHAWAVLHLPAGSDIDQVRSSYRRLARKWHPDRYANDPSGQAEAAIQMKVLNAAYRQLLAAAGRQSVRPTPEPSARPAGRRLSREEIDRLVASIGTESWIDSAFGKSLEWEDFPKSGRWWKLTPLEAVRLVLLAAILIAYVLFRL